MKSDLIAAYAKLTILNAFESEEYKNTLNININNKPVKLNEFIVQSKITKQICRVCRLTHRKMQSDCKSPLKPSLIFVNSSNDLLTKISLSKGEI